MPNKQKKKKKKKVFNTTAETHITHKGTWFGKLANEYTLVMEWVVKHYSFGRRKYRRMENVCVCMRVYALGKNDQSKFEKSLLVRDVIEYDMLDFCGYAKGGYVRRQVAISSSASYSGFFIRECAIWIPCEKKIYIYIYTYLA